ncbi:hypothetical protein VXN63_02260 [Marinilactibacillus sp. XAAS-LB27]|uniref:hypothetical protein n=1 Tax=Marinilactibacillus sp. XAAS-LB27 TaxID=3114538 RepID=UPI002E19E1EB|nr:hypothetical protein [Marinilactibacillus sp. XAAS-LB27]
MGMKEYEKFQKNLRSMGLLSEIEIEAISEKTLEKMPHSSRDAGDALQYAVKRTCPDLEESREVQDEKSE